MDKKAILREYFGYDSFKSGQEELIDSILSGRDAMGIMPTGGGKSLCYQIPALLLPGITLVISPLISLMKDQVAALTDTGIDAAFINSSLSAEQMRSAYQRIDDGQYKIIYVAPERLENDGFLSLIRRQKLSLVAVDEAHCISQWGQDFRPSYLAITDFLNKLANRPVIAAFTATATEEVRHDIIRILKLSNPFCVVTGFDRPNLYFDVLRPKNKSGTLLKLVGAKRGQSGIIYCATRNSVERVCAELKAHGVGATMYHAGLPDRERKKNQEDFQYDRCPVMAATNAFGMGIDKSNVSFVIHYNMPKSIEAYYQEAGRAGRDGESADCILLYSAGDVQTAKYLIENGGGNEELDFETQRAILRQDYERLNQMTAYCKTSSCLRGYILDYFGQAHEAGCGNCGNCGAMFSTEDITVAAQMILSCVKRIRDYLGYNLGASLVIRVLRGGKDKRLLELGLERLSTYGLMRHLARGKIQEYIDFLESQGYLHTNEKHSALELTGKASEILFDGVHVEIPIKAGAEILEAIVVPVSSSGELDEESAKLYDVLRTLRNELAAKDGVPAYVIFSNATLADMSAKKPQSPNKFLSVKGVGQKKAEQYGEQFMNAIGQYMREN